MPPLFKNVRFLAVLLVVEIFAAYFLFYLPLTTNIEAEQTIKSGYAGKMEEIKAKPKEPIDVKNPELVLPSQIKSEEVINWLDRAAAANSLLITQISQAQPLKNSEVERQDITIELEGPKEDLSVFIGEMEKQPRLMNLLSWQVTPTGTSVRATLKIAIYAMP